MVSFYDAVTCLLTLVSAPVQPWRAAALTISGQRSYQSGFEAKVPDRTSRSM